ncbi:ribonucleotide reductase of class Ia (aerobic) alpha subunit [Roseobacter phage DSS3P8]|nr:ribonucleotide reductase of class Ia (aerobic) alpha subunit [Roseobacter phage DSS3P8]
MAFEWVTEDTRTFMARGYLLEGETVEQRCRDIADEVGVYMGDKKIADKIYHYLSAGYYSLASPVWSNFGRVRGLPISCNNSYIPDDTAAIYAKLGEIGVMTKHGAGTSAYIGDIRPRKTAISAGGYASGVSFPALLIDSAIDNTSQGNIRRGNAAIYLDVEHGDIEEFLEFREEGSGVQHLSLGVCISDAWMEAMIAGDKDKRKLWARIIKKRFESGYPYIVWSDTANNNAPDVYKDLGRRINGSNLCSEIMLSSTEDESFVCDLSSMNLLKFDEWEHTDAVECLVYVLDAVMEEYIRKTVGMRFMEAAHRFAVNQRALGVGTLGYHSYLQSKMIPFESFEAKLANVKMHKLISERCLEASKELAAKFGEPPMLEGYGRRNVTLMAIAPTTSSSFILGQVSPSIEPLASNYFTKDLAKGKFTYRNPYLSDLLQFYAVEQAVKYATSSGMTSDEYIVNWLEETWYSILSHGGSVQHLEFLSTIEKGVFRTFSEISPLEIIQQAAARQHFIDQSQSLNLMIPPNADLKDVNKLMIEAWRLGIKSLYYQRSSNPAQELVRNLNACVSCEG